MKINKWSFMVSVINIVLAGLAIYVLKEYEHRTDIVSSQHPITDFHILKQTVFSRCANIVQTY